MGRGGPAVRMDFRERGASGGLWVPSSQAGLLLHLESDRGVTLSGSDVSAWLDQSSGAYSFTPRTGAGPNYSASDAALNNLASILFDSTVSDRMQSGAASSVWKPLHDGTGMVLGIALRTPASVGTSEIFIDTSDGGNGVGIRFGWLGATGKLRASIYGTAGAPLIDDFITVQLAGATSYRLIISYIEGASPEILVTLNSSDVISVASLVAPNTGNPVGTLQVGGKQGLDSAAFSGKLGAVIAYATTPTAALKTQLDEYLKKYVP